MHSAIYTGTVRHRRFSPHYHEFSYRMFMMYLDLDELPRLFEGRWFWSFEKSNLASFQRKNYLNPSHTDLKEAVLRRVEEVTGNRPDGSVRLLTHLTYFGLCFNPVSFYFVFQKSGELAAIVADVSNTPWNERNAYVVSPLTPEMKTKWGQRQIEAVFDKTFHVSPFLPMDMKYQWVISNPSDSLTIHMNNFKDQHRDFDATMVMERLEISGTNLARTLIFYPLMTLKVMSAIYGQALRLWIKQTPFYTHPGKDLRPPGSPEFAAKKRS